jgi:hypothetical protein
MQPSCHRGCTPCAYMLGSSTGRLRAARARQPLPSMVHALLPLLFHHLTVRPLARRRVARTRRAVDPPPTPQRVMTAWPKSLLTWVVLSDGAGDIHDSASAEMQQQHPFRNGDCPHPTHSVFMCVFMWWPPTDAGRMTTILSEQVEVGVLSVPSSDRARLATRGEQENDATLHGSLQRLHLVRLGVMTRRRGYTHVAMPRQAPSLRPGRYLAEPSLS